MQIYSTYIYSSHNTSYLLNSDPWMKGQKNNYWKEPSDRVIVTSDTSFKMETEDEVDDNNTVVAVNITEDTVDDNTETGTTLTECCQEEECIFHNEIQKYSGIKYGPN